MHVSVSWRLSEEVAPHPVTGLVFQVEDAWKFPEVLCFESLVPFLRIFKQGPCFSAIEKNGGDKRLFQLAKLIVLLRQILFNLATAATAEAILMRISAELVPSLYRFAPGYLKLVTSSNSSRSC